MSQEGERLLTLREAAAEISRSRMTLVRHIQAGNLHADKVGPYYVIRESEWERFKANRREPHRPRRKPSPPSAPG